MAGREKAEAQNAAEAISAKRIQVKTERVFRSGETPQLKLATRNVPSVKVRVYKIDLETYFRKMHSIAGIQRLDVSLIDPDATLEFAVPDYAKYKPLTSSVPVPLPDGLKAGVAAVTVGAPVPGSSDAGDHHAVDPERPGDPGEEFSRRGAGLRRERGDRQAVARSSLVDFRRPQRLCRGEDWRRWLFPAAMYAELKDAACLRVFAAAEGGHVASTAVHACGQPVARGTGRPDLRRYRSLPATSPAKRSTFAAAPVMRTATAFIDRAGQEADRRSPGTTPTAACGGGK